MVTTELFTTADKASKRSSSLGAKTMEEDILQLVQH